jgi:hypothetical protein
MKNKLKKDITYEKAAPRGSFFMVPSIINIKS